MKKEKIDKYSTNYENLYKILASCLVLFFAGFLFTSAYFAQFILTTPSSSVSLASLESATLDLAITPRGSFDEGETMEFPYKISRYDICNEYNEDWECTDQVPNLCPYISLSPKGEESTEIGFSKQPPFFSSLAEGQLSSPDDLLDNWGLTITSPCFEGQCPANYDSYSNGNPLPQSLKGQVFKCNIVVESTERPPLVKRFIGSSLAYAQTYVLNEIEVSAILTGEYTPEPEGNSSVLFIPGIMASRLYKQGNSLEDQLWEPISRYDVAELYMDENGQSINPNIYTREIIKEINLPFSGQNIYKSFSNMMDSLVSDGLIKEWKSYPYDWRYSVDDILETGTQYQNETKNLIDVLENLVQNSDSGKVIIIAHSNGGLLAKALLKKLQDNKNAGLSNLIDKVDVLVLVAVPQIGTGKAVPTLLHGYDQKLLGGLIMNESQARILGVNMPGAYGLLPSKEYINRVTDSPISFDFGVTTNIFNDAYGNVIDSYAEYKNFLFGGEGRENPSIENTGYPIRLSQSLFNKAEDLHNQIDNWIPPESMRVIEVAGWGLDTVAGFNYYSKYTGCKNTQENCKDGYILDSRPVFTIDGDKTVVVPSAQYMSGDNVEQYWVDLNRYNEDNISIFGKEHKNVLETSYINNLIQSVLNREEIATNSYIKDSTPFYNENRLRLSIHSPVKIGAYDNEGNFTGKVCEEGVDFCYIEEGIVNSSYMEFGEGKYLNLPEEELDKVVLEGTDVGTFTFEVEKVLPGQTSETYYFKDILVTPQMKGEFSLSQMNGPELHIDVDGDGINDFQIDPQDDFDPIFYLEIMKKTVQSLDLKENRKNNFIKRIDRVIKLINKGKIDKAGLRAEKFTEVLEKRLDKKDSEKPKPGRLTKQQAEDLLVMLENLLNYLE
ncbi:MAG: hypothetical protein WC095_01405 [Candidatus Paceibacterota bacterium]